MNNKILDDQDTDFIILAGIRYGIGRRSYSAWLITDWVKNHWCELSDSLKSLVKKDIKSEIEMWDRSPELSLGDPCDIGTWRDFAKWLSKQHKDGEK